MTIKKKRFPIFFILFTLTYLVFEIAFRTEFLEFSTNIGLSDPLSITTFEIFGRFLASIGFVIFVVSNVRINIKKSKWGSFFAKIIGYPILCVAAFAGFFNFQEVVIDHLARDFSPAEKRELLTLNLLRDALYAGKISHDEDHPFQYENRNDPSSKLYISLFPFLSMDDEDLMRKTEDDTVKRNLLINSVNNKLNVDEHVDNMMVQESRSLAEMWRGFIVFDNTYFTRNQPSSNDTVKLYGYTQSNYLNNFKEVKSYRQSRNYDVSKLYPNQFLTEDEFNNKILNTVYSATHALSMGRAVKKPEKLKTSYMSYIVNHLFDDDLGWKIYNWRSTPFKIANTGIWFTINNFGYAYYYSNILNSFPINEENCKLYEGAGPSLTINGKSKDEAFLKGIDFTLAGRAIFGDNFNADGKNSLSCNIPYSNYVRTKKSLYQKLTKGNPTYSMPDYEKKDLSPEVINSNSYLRKIAHHTLDEGVKAGTGKYLIETFNYDFEKYNLFLDTLNYSSLENFQKSIVQFYRAQYIDNYLQRAREQGLNLDFLRDEKNKRLSYEEFVSLPQVKSEIKKAFPFFIDSDGNVMNHLEFSNYQKVVSDRQRELFKEYLRKKEYDIYSKVIKDPQLLEEDGQYYTLGNNIAKSFIAPPLVLSISGIMIILSLANIAVKITTYFIQEPRKVLVIKGIVMLLLVFIPILTPNSFSSNHEIMSDRENNPFKYNLLIWLQNSESVIEHGKIDNEIFKTIYDIIKINSVIMFVDDSTSRDLIKMKVRMLQNKKKLEDNKGNEKSKGTITITNT